MFHSSVFFILLMFPLFCFGETPATLLNITEREINVNGRKASIYTLVQPDGTFGLTAKKGEQFNVRLINHLHVPTSIHWHGILLPNDQDGVAFITQYPIYPGIEYHYTFPLVQAGTFFMHAHYGLQEQKLLSAPLILLDEDEFPSIKNDRVIVLTDFSFKSPSEIFYELRCSSDKMKMKPGNDIVDVQYDAFLANFKTFDSPEIFEFPPESQVRLRFINASSATNFWIFLGDLEGEAIAVDGNRIVPLRDHTFELGIAQRIDIKITIPKEGGTFPILAQGEGTNMLTGVIVKTAEASLPQLNSITPQTAKALSNEQELKLKALNPLPSKKIDRKVLVELGGEMAHYRWTLNGKSWPEAPPILVEKGERVEMTFKNATAMTHPMHFHGHVFQVTEIDGKILNGAMRDTVLVSPWSTVRIQFDANNPGVWPLHCHLLYHLEAGMFTVVRYKGYVQALTP